MSLLPFLVLGLGSIWALLLWATHDNRVARKTAAQRYARTAIQFFTALGMSLEETNLIIAAATQSQRKLGAALRHQKEIAKEMPVDDHSNDGQN